MRLFDELHFIKESEKSKKMNKKSWKDSNPQTLVLDWQVRALTTAAF